MTALKIWENLRGNQEGKGSLLAKLHAKAGYLNDVGS